MTDNLDIDGDTTVPSAEKKKGGWPKGKPRTPRAGETLKAATAEPVRSTVRERKRKGGAMVDRFYVPPEMVPDGMSWEWKRESVFGKEDDSYMAFMHDQGFLPVEQSRYPGFPVRRDGMILMERPIELTREAREEERQAARNAVAEKERQLTSAGPGEFERRRADGSSTVSVRTTIERGIPVE